MTPLCFSEKIIHEINTIFYSFVWNAKGDKIKRSVMIDGYAERGLKCLIFNLSFWQGSKSHVDHKIRRCSQPRRMETFL